MKCWIVMLQCETCVGPDVVDCYRVGFVGNCVTLPSQVQVAAYLRMLFQFILLVDCVVCMVTRYACRCSRECRCHSVAGCHVMLWCIANVLLFRAT